MQTYQTEVVAVQMSVRHYFTIGVTALSCQLCAAQQSLDLKARTSDAVATQQFMLALPLLEEMVRAGDDSEKTLSDVAWTLFSLGNVEEAQHVCSQALKRYPHSAPISYTSALILAEKGRFEDALQRIATAVSTDPSSERYKVVKGMLLLQLGRERGADTIQQEIAESNGDGQLLKALVLASKGQTKESLSILKKLVAGSEKAYGVKYQFARIASTQVQCETEDAKLALDSMVEVLAWAQKEKIEFAPPCLLYLVAACTYANSGQFEVAEITSRTAHRMYESRCGVEKIVFQEALEAFKQKKRFVKKQWP
jgi:tetratricopeptide (TPR) repeat protein